MESHSRRLCSPGLTLHVHTHVHVCFVDGLAPTAGTGFFFLFFDGPDGRSGCRGGSTGRCRCLHGRSRRGGTEAEARGLEGGGGGGWWRWGGAGFLSQQQETLGDKTRLSFLCRLRSSLFFRRCFQTARFSVEDGAPAGQAADETSTTAATATATAVFIPGEPRCQALFIKDDVDNNRCQRANVCTHLSPLIGRSPPWGVGVFLERGAR